VKIYVAGPFGMKDYIGAFMRRLEHAGHEITHDWTTSEDALQNQSGEALPSRIQRHYADLDLEGVRQANLLWLLLQPHYGAGCFVEFGYALALKDKPLVYISGPVRTIFETLANRRYQTHEDAFEAITS
jgi:nucleoside 2-deoxyribosyltransferase